MSVLSRIARAKAVRSFGKEHFTNWPIRSLRTVEEAIELCQALGVPKRKVLQVVHTVYARPVGEAYQEIGGVLLTIAILCESMGIEPDTALELELQRVLSKSPEHFAKRNQDKIDLGLDVSPVGCTPGDLESRERAERERAERERLPWVRGTED